MKVAEDIGFKKRKDEQVVQFGLTNTTPNPVSVNLFDISTLIQTPTTFTYISPPNTSVSTFGASAFVWLAINPTNGYLYANDGSNTIQVFDTNNGNVFVTNIIIPLSNLTSLVYNSVDNTVYVFDTNSNNFFVIDCNTNLVVATVVFGVGLSSIPSYITSINSIYVGDGLITRKIDCSTNTSSPTTLIHYDSYVYNSTNGYVYAIENSSLFFDVINPLNDTVIQSVSIPTSFDQISLNPNIESPYIYCVTILSGDVYVYDWSNLNSFVTIISPSIGQLLNGVYDVQTNNVYFGSNSGNILVVDSFNNFQTSFIAPSLLFSPVLNSNQNSIYFASPFTNNINQITTTGISNTPYYITGSVDYNFFLQNIETEPIVVYYINLISDQNQLAKVLQITEIDANGNQRAVPHFPILGVSAWQEQGNRGYVDFKGKLVLDGRTFISNYVLNPNESITLEIHYSQLGRNKINKIFEGILPKKKPLKGLFDEYVEL